MEIVTEEFFKVLPHRKIQSSQGWYNFPCPACGDRRMRGGFLITPTGGFRVSCFNGGCEYQIQPTGWEPDNAFVGRARKCFELFGGDIRNIPIEFLYKEKTFTLDKDGQTGKEEKLEVVHKFDETPLPKNSQLLVEAAESNTKAYKVLEYLYNKNNRIVEKFPFMWSEEHPNFFIIPYIHHDKIVGYVGRNILKRNSDQRFIQSSPSDYIFNQHLLWTYKSKYLFVVESPYNAILLNCFATRSATLTKKQVNLFNSSGKNIVLIPDRKDNEWESFFNIAKREQWSISIPEWGKGIKDISDSESKNGLLYTIHTIMSGITNNYDKALLKLKL